MYLHREFLATSHVLASIGKGETPDYIDVEAAVLRGRNIRAESFGRLLDKTGAAIAKGVLGIAQGISRWQREAAALRELNRLDARLLADIGLTRGDIERAAREGRKIQQPAAPASTAPAAAANDGGSRQDQEAA